MWPVLIFLTLVLVVVLRFLWQEHRLRLQREKAHAEFQKETFTQQKLAYEQSVVRQEALFDSMIEGVLLVDPAGKIQMANESLRRLLSVPAEMSGRTVQEVFRWPALVALMEKMATQSTVEDEELTLVGDKPRVLLVNASAIINRDGERQGTIYVFHEVTRVKELENTRQEFVANVSHELRTPLSLIKGFTETLLGGAKDDPEVSVKFLQKIDKHADRLVYLIEDLLTISRLESGQIAMNSQRLELSPLVARVFGDLEARAKAKHVTLVNAVPATAMVWADGDRLQQVFSNLVENAIKYGKESGRVEVSLAGVSAGKFKIGIHDDGPGIPAEALGRVFERFYRIDKARSRETGGTGLGLSIVKHIVLGHGGEVWAESPPGQGTTFYFTIGRQPPSEPAASPAPSASGRPG